MMVLWWGGVSRRGEGEGERKRVGGLVTKRKGRREREKADELR
jgi:hypothetical protein